MEAEGQLTFSFHAGTPKTGGRKKGTSNRRTQEIAEKFAELGCEWACFWISKQRQLRKRTRPVYNGPIDLDAVTVHLSAAASLAGQVSVLSSEERRRAARFVFEKDRALFVAGRVLIRTVLSEILGVDAQSVPIRIGPRGRPELASPGGEVTFNLSHSGVYVAAAFSRDRRIGIDIEMRRPGIDVRSLAARHFSVNEASRLAEAPEELFFRYWTLKATGEGSGERLCDLDVSGVTEPGGLEVEGIVLRRLEAPPGYDGALAADRAPWQLRFARGPID